jgi:APA family basic amino acid/polyamine antiporter
MYLVPIERVASGETFAAEAGEVLFGRLGGQVFSAIVVISVIGSLAAIIISAPRVYFAMARDHLFLPAAASIHPRFGTPFRAIVLQGVMASLLVALGTFNEIVAYFIFVTVVFIGLTVGAVFILRKRQPDAPAYTIPWYPVTPILFLALTSILLLLMAAHNPAQAFLGVAVVALGVPVYQIVRGAKRHPKNLP